MEFPLQLSFRILALAPQLTVTDARGEVLGYVQQKLLKLKEAITVYEGPERQEVRYRINADRMLDISARYLFQDPEGTALGGVRRRGMRSLWRAHYEVFDPAEALTFQMTESNPWIKMMDGLLGAVPILEFFTGYFLHPSYEVLRENHPVARITKQPAFLEGRFTVERLESLSGEEEERLLLSLIMLVLLERERG